MSYPGYSDELAEAVRVRAQHPSTAAAARAMGLPRKTLGNRLAAAERGEATPNERQKSDPPPSPDEIESLLSDLPDYEGVKRRLAGYNQDYIDQFHSSRHLHLTVPHGVFLQFFIGDPHRDSPGHDDDAFEADMGLMRRAQAEFPTHIIQMGDVLDSWPSGGRLGKKLLDSHITRKEALSLVRGLAMEEGLDFTIWLIGNHDAWPGIDFEVLLRQWVDCPVVDWASYIHVKTDKGFAFDIFAAHDMPGHSISNPVHALARRAREEGECDLYVAAHRHKGGQGKDQNGYRSKTYNYMRVRGYKRADEYAWAKGYGEEEEGATGLAVINPDAKTQDGRCRTFYDLEEGLYWARFLTKR